jgi:hypothetical protein
MLFVNMPVKAVVGIILKANVRPVFHTGALFLIQQVCYSSDENGHELHLERE